MSIGLYHKKTNTGEKLSPRGFRFLFTRDRVRVEPMDPTAIPSLASHLSLTDRLKRHMTEGEFYSYTDLAQDLDTKADSIRRAVMRSGAFDRVGRKVRLKSQPDQADSRSRVQQHEF